MKKHFMIVMGLIALVISAAFYLADYFIFHDGNQLISRLIEDLAFLPIDVFIVLIIIERLLDRQEKQSMMHKLNMVIGTFFSEVGNHLLTVVKNGGDSGQNYDQLAITQNWKDDDFKKAAAFAKTMNVTQLSSANQLEELKSFMQSRQPFLLRLLENPNLLEHESFTDLLWAVFHLSEELEARTTLQNLSPVDLKHINGDISRIQGLLVIQWLSYSRHLQSSYPYLFSLLVRTQPFQKNPTANLS